MYEFVSVDYILEISQIDTNNNGPWKMYLLSNMLYCWCKGGFTPVIIGVFTPVTH